MQAALTRRDGYTGGPQPPSRKGGHHNEVVTEPVPHVLRDDQRGAGLVRIIGLARREDEPDLSASRMARRLFALQPVARFEAAAARRIDRQASRSLDGTSSVLNCASIAAFC